ncbi:MAG: Scr1 family TA system antitoxin-like transcriptional regulator [Pseudonocardiaceae bacterium]
MQWAAPAQRWPPRSAHRLHASMSGSFAVLTFDPGVAPPFGYQEHAIGGHVVDDRNAVSQLVEVWELLRSPALGIPAAAAFLGTGEAQLFRDPFAWGRWVMRHWLRCSSSRPAGRD